MQPVKNKRLIFNSLLKTALVLSVSFGVLFSAIPIAVTGAQAAGRGCEQGSLCGIGGKTFQSIYYSSGVSGLVVLYDKARVGDVKPWVSQKKYRRGTGTVEDAIAFLRGDLDYAGYRVVRGTKSTGLFKSEVIDGIYVVVPKHSPLSSTRAPQFRFSEKSGTMRLYITDFDMGQDDSDGM